MRICYLFLRKCWVYDSAVFGESKRTGAADALAYARISFSVPRGLRQKGVIFMQIK